MITLSATNHSIDVTMTAITTNQVEYYAAYADEVFTAPGSHAPAPVATSLSGPGPSTVLSAPAAGVVRQLKYLSIANKDTVANTQNIQFNVGGTRRTIIQVTLQPGESLHYLNDASWRTYTSTGAVKAVAGDVVGPTSAVDGHVPTYSGTSGKLIQDSGVYPVVTKVLSADVSSSSVTAATVADLTVTLVAGTYTFEYHFFHEVAGTATGIKFNLNYTGTTTYGIRGSLRTATQQSNDATANHGYQISATTTITTDTTTAASDANDMFSIVSGAIVVSNGGDLQFRWGAQTAASAATIRRGSFARVVRVS